MPNAHTPGPWKVQRLIEVGGDRYIRAVVDESGEHIAHVCSLEPGLDESVANAHLLASAPKLLTMLEQLCELMESMGHDVTPSRDVIAEAKAVR